jgi:hypothetical protein
MKHLPLVLVAFVLIFGIAIFNIQLLSEPENTWLCRNGIWVQYGQPSTPMPAKPCGFRQQKETKTNIIVGGKTATSADEIKDEIKLSIPKSNEIVSSPLVVEGSVKGSWFFEASFPIKLIGEDGKILTTGIASAQSDWMTEDFVPFKSTLNFNPGSSTIGMLVLQNDNPSGLPENDKQFGIPVKFSNQEKITVKVYFGNLNFNPNAIDSSLVYPMLREVNKTQLTARAALEELLTGPTEAEKSQGYYTSINPGVKINSLTITRGVAKVDFDEQMDFQMGGSCRVTAIRAQIVETLKQFPTVKNVIISVAGNVEEALQP